MALLYKLRMAGHSIQCVLFDYKQQHAQELTFAKLHCHRLGAMFTTLELPPLGGLTDASWIVPNRNAIMLSIAVNLAVQREADTVTIGCNSEDAHDFPDCRKHFIKRFNSMLRSEKIAVEVWAPFIDWPKWKIGGLAQEMGIPLHEIWTCYRGGEKPCGKCPACKKLEAAIK